jgi:hypothetical protein
MSLLRATKSQLTENGVIIFAFELPSVFLSLIFAVG